MERMTPLDQGTQELAPLALMLLIHQRLGTPDLSNPRIAVLLSSVAHPGSVHLTPEPLFPVQTHLNEKRKPALQSKMQKTQLLMHPIKRQVHAFTPLKLDLQLTGPSIAAQKPGATRFYATQNSDQPLAHLVALLDLAGHFLLACAARREINHRTLMPPGQLLRCLTNTTGQVGCESLKILPQHSGLPKVLFHHRLIIQTTQRPLQPKTIPAVQYSDHIGLMLLYKSLSNLVLRQILIIICSHDSTYLMAPLLSFWLRLCRPGSFVVRCFVLFTGKHLLALAIEFLNKTAIFDLLHESIVEELFRVRRGRL